MSLTSPFTLQVLILDNFLAFLKTKKCSCMTARGVTPAAYPVCGMCCLGRGWESEEGWGYPDLGPDWGPPPRLPGKGLGPDAGKGPGTRDWGTCPPPQWTDRQTENITLSRTSHAGGNNSSRFYFNKLMQWVLERFLICESKVLGTSTFVMVKKVNPKWKQLLW